ncbi:hypothetical protein NQD34_005487 [Periophthalmus magnuspinnatus]|nr:hypothetical protein NQD34_005487 [Periophthalmus magnuspinnatus]
MKVDRSKLKKTPTEACELYHWVDLLDRFDGILCDAGQTVENMSWLLVCDRPDNSQLKALLLAKYPPSATTLHFEFYAEPGPEVKIERKISESPSEIMESLTAMYNIPKDKQTLLFTHIRLAHGFSNHKKRLQAVQARLHAISILVYSNALQESANSILYNGLIEELVDVLQITDKQLVFTNRTFIIYKVIKFLGDEQDQITFVTRAVRVVDLITNLDMAAFQSHSGLSIFICRLEHEVDLSRKECPFVIKPKIQRPNSAVDAEDMDTDMEMSEVAMESSPGPSTSSGSRPDVDHRAQNNAVSTPRAGMQCIPQRAALLKSMLNFLKKAIQDSTFTDGIRHTTEVVTVFVFQEPSLLSSLQDNGLTDVMLHALLIKDVPATREVLGSLPNVFSALCLNARGLHSFVQCQPFERLFKVLLSPDYLPAMRRRRSSDPLGDTASNLGSAVDELMRHQPTLKTDATTAIIKLLEEICNLGRAPEYICQKPSIQKADGTVAVPPARSSHAAEEASSEDEEEEEALHTFSQQGEPESNRQSVPLELYDAEVVGTEELIPIPLMDYILNVMKFVESILSNNTTDDHCQEFVNQKGLLPLVSILGLPNLPIDFPTSAACQAVAGVCKSILSEIRAISVNQWGSQLGLSVLNKLSQLYCSLVWESTVLLSLCTPNSLPPGCEFGQADMQKLVPKEEKPSCSTTTAMGSGSKKNENEAVSVDTSAGGLLEGMGLDGDTLAPMETDEPTTSDPKTKSKLTPAMATRIKQIKPLLSASSRLGRALAELFGLLVKLCVGSPVRQRRSHHATSTGTTPTPAARATASALTKLLTKGLSWQPPPYTPTPRFRTFNWALTMGGKVPVSEGLEHVELPDGTGEFLDAWLMLVEKMVNPSTVLDSPHSLPAKMPGVTPTMPQFSALRFLIVTQKAAFNCIRSLWNRKPLKVYGGRMAESMLAILCHILRGEPVIQERLAKEREGTVRPEEEAASTGSLGGTTAPGSSTTSGEGSAPTGSSTGAPPAGSAEDSTNSSSRREPQLVDMGFSREHAMEALLNTSTMEQATEYLLTHPPPLLSGAVRDLTMSEEDQMMRAIAMSLGQEVSMEQRSDSPEEAARRREEEDRRARERAEEEEARCLERFMEAEPLDPQELHAFTDAMLPGCFHLLDELPDTVYRLCDLLMTAIKRSGPEYRDLILGQVVHQVWEAADVLIKAAVPLTTSDTKTVSEWTRQMATLPQASKLATRILLLTLLFEELKLLCARVVENSGILDLLIKLLEVVQPCLQAAKEQKDIQTPKWITPVLLLIDFYEKMAVSSKRRAEMNKYLQPNGNNWRWFDDRSGRWCSYSASNNSTIDSAWRAGETSVRFTAGRRRYTVQFNTMVQVNEETGNRRPVMLTVMKLPRLAKTTKANSITDSEKEEGEKNKVEETQTEADSVAPVEMTAPKVDASQTKEAPSGSASSQEPEHTQSSDIVVQGLSEDMTTILIRACVSMISVPVDPDTLHATLRLCLRLTRNHQYAMMFAELKSTRMILGLTQSSGFNGFTPLVTLLFRHIIEDPATLRHTMEKVVRSAVTSGAGSTTSGVVSGSLGSREINYILRVLGPAACRNPECFIETASNCVRIALPAPRGAGTASDDEFENLRIRGPNAVQLVKTTPLKLSPLPSIPDTIKEVLYDMLNALAAYHAPEEPNSPEEMREEKKEQEGEKSTSLEEGKAAKAKASKPLMPTSTILRLLAELVRSYVGIATLIASYCYTAGQSELIKEVCTDAQVALVNEVKAALSRALAMAEGAEKHASPNMANTVNAALKPLETLSRIVNQPSSLFGGKGGSSKNKTEHDTVGTARDSNSNTQDQGESGEAEPVEGNHRVTGPDSDLMDGETEGDTVVIAGQPEVLSTQAMQVENELVDLIDELLERDAGTVNSTIIVGRSAEDESQEDVLMDEAPSNISQASTLQANREDSMNILEPEDEEHTQEEDSSGSNDDEDSQDEEEEEEEEEEEDQDDEEGDEDDDDEGSEMELDEDFPDINAAPHIRFERFDRDDDLIIEFDNMFSNNADIPPSPGNIPSSHPLMVRHADHGSLTLGVAGSSSRLAQGMGRSQRTLRQLTANSGHTIHVHYPGNRQPNPPLILQRLLGPSAAADILQLSSSLPLQSRGRARLLVGNEDVHIIARSDDELFDDFFHEQSGTGGQAGTLSSIPTALTRWTDECKVLDAESMHDCVAVVKIPILQHLEYLRDEELEERREKRRRQMAEEEESKQNERRASGAEQSREQSLQGSGLGTVNGAENTAEGEQAQGSAVTCLDPPRVEGFLTAPPSGEVTPTTPAPHEPALVSLETAISQQVHQPIADLLLAESHASSLAALAGAGLASLSDRQSNEVEASQMEMSPAPTIGERAGGSGGGERGGADEGREASLSPDIVESSEPAAVGVSQLEGSPMDTSSPASATQEEAASAPPQTTHLSQELSGSGESGLTDRQTDVETGSTSVSSPGETMPRSDSADSQTQAIQEEPLPSTSNEEEDPLAGHPQGGASKPAGYPTTIPSAPANTSLPSSTAPVLGAPGVTEVSPEFLAALPPAIQEEVLAQQRAEQQRRELAQQPPQGDTPLDPVTFIQTLPSELRRSVLEDMEDSVLAVMPPDIAAEAAALRREQEARQRQLMHERLFGHSSSSALSAILREEAPSKWQEERITDPPVPMWTRCCGYVVRLLLDHEALSCLLVLLFVDEPKLNTSRLHRVLRNLCYHSQTRGWVIRSLLSILQRSSESEVCVETSRLEESRGKRSIQSGCGGKGSAVSSLSSSSSSSSSLELLNRVESRSSSQLSWLSVSMDAALGCRTNIFQIQRASGRKHADRHSAGSSTGSGTIGAGMSGATAGVTCAGGGGSTVHIHPQAAPVVCRHVLDTLIQLAKVFPSHFTQQRCKDLSSSSDLDSRLCTGPGGGSRSGSQSQTCVASNTSNSQNTLGSCVATPQSLGISTDFWDLLVKLDNMNVSRKGKASMKTVPLGGSAEAEGAQFSLETSPLGQLMNMLSHPVIRRSSLLTEKLLRLLSLISIALPDNKATEVPAGHPTPQAANPSAASSSSTTVPVTTTTTTLAGSTQATVTVPIASATIATQGTNAPATSLGASTTPSTTISIPTSTGTTVAGKPRGITTCTESEKMASSGLTEKQLQLSVEVLTSHSCSEEGLEDAANILLQLSRGDCSTRDTVLRLLLSGARHLGYTLCKQIGTLLAELREYNLEQQRRAHADSHSPDAPSEDSSLSARLKGKMTSRFDGAESVVIVAAQKRTLGGRELQLPCMSSLTSKTSTQKFFLRVLQVIIQLREDTRRANKKAKQTGRLGSASLGSASSIQAAVRQLEAEADAIIQMVREGQRARRLQQAAPPTASAAVSVAAGSSVAPTHAPAGAAPPAGTAAATSDAPAVSETQAQRDDSPMDVDQPSPLEQDPAPLDEDGNGQSEAEERLPDLPLLSEQLLLDELWDMLGECLKELEESHDQHAVLGR